MKAVSQLFFVLFYVTSTYAAVQIRTADLIHKIQSFANPANGSTLKAARSTEFDNLPRYREAKKKAPTESKHHPVREICLTLKEEPIIVFDELEARSEFRLSPSHSRAPPVQS